MDCTDLLTLDPGKVEEFLRCECRKTSSGLINKRSGRQVKAILPVHVFGNPCEMGQLMALGSKYGLRVIEDAAESIGSYFTEGRFAGKHTGTIADAGVYSFNGNKIITTGSGGMIVTENSSLARRALYLTNQAKDDPLRYIHHEVGYNFRLSSVHAALGSVQLSRLEGFIAVKKRNYLAYQAGINGKQGMRLLGVPAGTRPNYWFYSLVIDPRSLGRTKDQVISRLARLGIETRPVWYPNHLQKPFRRNQAYRIEKAEWYWERIVNIPCSTGLTLEQRRTVIRALNNL
jgi:perosamine synthetase